MARITLRTAPLPQGRCEQKAEIVLCFLTHNTAHPFATWQRNIADGDTYWGHYFAAYKDAEEDFKDRAVKLHGKVRKPFNLDIHAALIAEGFMLIQHDDDFEDDGDAESGPHLTGGPAYDEYECPDYRIIVTHDGVVAHHEPRDLAYEKYIEEMAAQYDAAAAHG